MALNKTFLTKLGVDKELIGDIMDEHGEVISFWKDEVKKYKEEAAKLPEVQKELDELKAASENDKAELDKLKAEAEKGNPFEEKYNKLKKQFDDFKTETETKEHKAAVDKAVKAYFEEKNIKGANLDIALRAAQGEISTVELEDGKIKDTKTLDELVGGTLSGLVSKTGVQGANVPNPPSNTGGKTKVTWEDIDKITNAEQRQKAMAENMESLGIK